MNPRFRSAVLPPAIAVVFSVMLCSIVLAISGANVPRTLGVMVAQVGKDTTAVDIVNSAAVYYLAAVAVAIGFQMNLFNIGVEGQYRVAGIVAAVVGGGIALPPVLHPLLIIVAAMFTGAAWALIPALLKAYRGVHEVISTIMMNAIALGVTAYLLRVDVFGEQRGNNVSTHTIPDSGTVGGFGFGSGGTVFGLLLLSVVVGVGYWMLLNRTRFGFELIASGQSPTAAAAGGINAKRMIVSTMLISGAIAGLISLPEILGRDHQFSLTFTAGYGFTGIAVALLGRNHPGGIAFGALLWAFLDRSGLALDNIGVPREIVTIMQGAIVLSVVVAYEAVRRMDLAAEKAEVGEVVAQ
ncbi:ABC transporter permease [Pseudonocardiaceae bacterium YIM PH 21723]|nr:ABC transporter permease [Pseudonocardiaceae bacterium YIM PH 21723]